MGQYDRSTFDLLHKVFAREQEIHITSAGNSMYPLIKEGNDSVFTKVSPSEIKRGDILLFRDDKGRLIGHRFYYKDPSNFYYCKGDSNLSFDRPIPENHILGKLKKIQKKNILLHEHDWTYKIWGSLVIHIPLISRLLRKYLNVRNS
ncbi:signal peptidase I [Paenibacillus sp. Soil787]|uniref:signal peptidase I n=1 Tax=Paenibacillus sp. Soil787 TaxID=1736411 RepID=UPI0006F39A42|nr:signal peptidase I [Paenibacillus sp. Soil787]KRF35889.1 hypothetical protein ASG93_25745 [Paenibacillus sp. Soil787]